MVAAYGSAESTGSGWRIFQILRSVEPARAFAAGTTPLSRITDGLAGQHWFIVS